MPEPVRQRSIVQLFHLAFGRTLNLQAILLLIHKMWTRATALRRLSHRAEERTLSRPGHYGAEEHSILITMILMQPLPWSS